MHDIKSIRDNPQVFDAGLARRGLKPLSAALLDSLAQVLGGHDHLTSRAVSSKSDRNAVLYAGRAPEEEGTCNASGSSGFASSLWRPCPL